MPLCLTSDVVVASHASNSLRHSSDQYFSQYRVTEIQPVALNHMHYPAHPPPVLSSSILRLLLYHNHVECNWFLLPQS